jgi:cytochrome c-type biogenesis protein
MGGGDALLGGFGYFFTSWQLCYLQFSPFLVAFIVGIYLPAREGTAVPGVLRGVLPACVAYGVGFSGVYSLLIASGLSLSRPLINNIGPLRVAAGVLILLAGLHILLVDRVPALRRLHRPAVLSGLALVVGISFAIVYSPCITPMLSDIMGIASQRSTAPRGWYLALLYGLGSSIAACAVAIALVLFLRTRATVWRNARLITGACGVIVLALAFLNVSGLMTHYKAFALGFAL